MHLRRRRRLATATVVLGVAMLSAGPALAQSTQAVEDWRRTISNHVGVMMDLDPSDNVIALGYGSAALTRKYDRNGTLLWERPYPTADERALPSWISADLSGNAYVSAYLLTGTSSPSGWVVIKYDAQGNLLWKDTMPVARGRTVRLETDGAGNAYVIGTIFLGNSSGGATLDAVTIKYAPNGVRQWTRVFNGGTYADDIPNSVALSPDGSRIAVVGATVGTFFTVVYDAQGNHLGQTCSRTLSRPGTRRSARRTISTWERRGGHLRPRIR